MQNPKITQQIVNALQQAENSQQVFDALCEIPTPQLLDMQRMLCVIVQDRFDNLIIRTDDSGGTH